MLSKSHSLSLDDLEVNGFALVEEVGCRIRIRLVDDAVLGAALGWAK